MATQYGHNDRDSYNISPPTDFVPVDNYDNSYHSDYIHPTPAGYTATTSGYTPTPSSQYATDKSGTYHTVGALRAGPPSSQPLHSRLPVPAWLLEIGSMLLSIGALLAAIIVMAVQNGKPVTDWHFPASINTVVSALGVISKVSLAFTISACLGQQKWNWFRQHQGNVSLFEIFDSASRGPWGSLGLLIFTRTVNWAILGAIVTILTLTFDPFLQATVNLTGELSLSPSTLNSTISIAENMTMGSLADASGTAGVFFFEDGTPMDQFNLQQDFGLTSAIYDGFYLGAKDTAAKFPNVTFSCSTGNCTFPVFTSAAVCSKCNDVSDSVVRNRRTKCSFKDSTNQKLGSNIDVTDDCTEYTAPYANIKQFDGLSSSDDTTGQETTQSSTIGFVILTVNTTMDYSTTISFRDYETLFASFLMLRAPQDFIEKKINWEEVNIEATECGLYFCAAATKSTVNNGHLTEERLGVWSNRVESSWDSLATDDKSKNWAENVSPSLSPQTKYRSDLQVSIPDDEAKRLDAIGARVFNFTQASIFGMQETLQLLTLGAESTNETLLVYPTNARNSGISVLSPILGLSNNLTWTFEMLAQRLTVHIRDSGRMTQQGVVEEFIFLIKIDWPFLVAPILAVLAGVIYFLVIMFQTWRLGLPVWKESAYPTLTYGFDERTQSLFRLADVQGPGTVGGAKLLKKKTQIGLMEGQDGLRLNVAPSPGHVG